MNKSFTDETMSLTISMMLAELLIILFFNNRLRCEEKKNNKINKKKLIRILIIAQSIGYTISYLYSMLGFKSTGMDIGILTSIYVILIGPIFEELIFRGICVELLKEYGEEAQIVLSSLAFSLFHMSYTQMLTAFMVGILLAEIRVECGSIVPGIVVHIINNIVGSLIFKPTCYIIILSVYLVYKFRLPKINLKVLKENVSTLEILSIIMFIIISTLGLIAKN